jgi:hypothetical protein
MENYAVVYPKQIVNMATAPVLTGKLPVSPGCEWLFRHRLLAKQRQE